MRKILFHGKRVDNGEWVEGYLNYDPIRKQYYIMDNVNAFPIPVYEESVGQYAGMTEFVVKDRLYNKPLFEGDIVEVWGTRRPYYSNPKSQYDGDVKVRAVICFEDGKWILDYKNKYNESLAKLKGKETDERNVDSYDWLSYFGCHGDQEWQREHNAQFKWSDIVKIGTVFDNADLLEG
jgi:hypothetical protein